MVIIGIALVPLAAFAVLARAAERGSRAGRLGVLAGGALAFQLAACGLFFAVILVGIGCDDHCASGSGLDTARWWDLADAWQWWGQLAICVLGAVAVIAACVAVSRARYRMSIVLMGCAATAFGAWALLVAPFASAAGT